MLTTLRIKNLALVADLTLELQPGYNVITGETGAGKSIIIGALNLILGERADRALIRSGCESCSVEAIFEISQLRAPLKSFLAENGLESCVENQLILKRNFSTAGTNRQFINGSPATLSALVKIGEWLVDMHGPHDHQSLFHAANQLFILDVFGNLKKLREEFSALADGITKLETQKAALIVDEKTYAQQLDLLRFQVQEISSADFNPDEETEVEQEFQRASNASRLLQLSQTALAILSEDENSLMNHARALGRTIQELQRIDASAGCLFSLHEQAVLAWRDVQSDLSHYADKIDLNPERLQQLEERLDLIHSLKRKYGATLSEVIAFGEEAERKLQNLEQRDEELNRINLEVEKLRKELWRVGHELSTQRRKIIPKLSKEVGQQLKDLGFQQSNFDIAISTETQGSEFKIENTLNGFDKIEFQFAPNAGEPARPLRAIASSGEMARVMLALKTVLATQDEIPVLIFDEVDANVGGETASAVGEKMLQISRQRQVLCITHLPAVAATASAHYLVTKILKEGRTISEITLLNKAERVNEISRMLGGQS
ncbi:MAG: DNA repair protein RecN, partial [Verrucomicrobiota bacterium]|nr:DNA repair protein RecN [Verrucomicrobiota bacterium]